MARPRIKKSILLLIPVTFFGLGTWQGVRYYNKKHHADLVMIQEGSLSSQKVLDLDSIVGEPYDSKQYHHRYVSIHGTVLDPFLLLGPRMHPLGIQHDSLRSKDRDLGYYVIKPVRSTGGTNCLVNMGWISISNISKLGMNRINESLKTLNHFLGWADMKNEKKPFLGRENDTKNNIFTYKDISQMASQLSNDEGNAKDKNDSLPCFVKLVSVKMIDASIPIIPCPILEPRKIPHLEYMFTWYSLALITSYMMYLRW